MSVQSGQSPPPPAQAQQSGAAAPPPPNQGGGGGRPGWQIAVIVIAVVVGVFLAVNAVLIPYVLVRTSSPAVLLQPPADLRRFHSLAPRYGLAGSARALQFDLVTTYLSGPVESGHTFSDHVLAPLLWVSIGHLKVCELLQVRRHRRKQSELHGKYLKSEARNPEFEHDEGRAGSDGRGGGPDGNALARGDDYERLAVKKDGATAAGGGPVTPRSAKAATPRAGAGGAATAAGVGAGAGALGAGALGGLLGKKKVQTFFYSQLCCD